MTRDNWSIRIKGQEINSIRNYGTLIGLYNFTLRNTNIFSKKNLIIYKNYEPFLDTTLKKIFNRKKNYYSEKHEVKLINLQASIFGYLPTRKNNFKNKTLLIATNDFPLIVNIDCMFKETNHPRIKGNKYSIYTIRAEYEYCLKKNNVDTSKRIISNNFMLSIEELNEILKFTNKYGLTPILEN